VSENVRVCVCVGVCLCVCVCVASLNYRTPSETSGAVPSTATCRPNITERPRPRRYVELLRSHVFRGEFLAKRDSEPENGIDIQCC